MHPPECPVLLLLHNRPRLLFKSYLNNGIVPKFWLRSSSISTTPQIQQVHSLIEKPVIISVRFQRTCRFLPVFLGFLGAFCLISFRNMNSTHLCCFKVISTKSESIYCWRYLKNEYWNDFSSILIGLYWLGRLLLKMVF